MKTATIRHVQHNLNDVLRWVEDGEEVLILRRKKVVAKIVAADHASGVREWPDFVTRAKRLWKGRLRGKPVSRIVVEGRQDRL